MEGKHLPLYKSVHVPENGNRAVSTSRSVVVQCRLALIRFVTFSHLIEVSIALMQNFRLNLGRIDKLERWHMNFMAQIRNAW